MSRRLLAALAVVSSFLAIPLVPAIVWPGPAPVTDTPTLPSEFAAFSRFTAHAEQRPAGRAIALFETGSWEFAGGGDYQALAVGADRDSYRQVDGGKANMCADAPILLSPDGTHVLRQPANAGPDQFELLDLLTGRSTPRHGVAWTPAPDINSPYTEVVALLAWSPDGRHVAYAVHVVNCQGTVATGFEQRRSLHRQLAILDLATDRAVLTDVHDVVNAAFAPDSARLAVALPTEGVVVSVDGTRLGSWTTPTGTYHDDPTPGFRSPLLPGGTGMAWSPDGALLAVSGAVYCGPSANRTGGGPRMTVTEFVDMSTGEPMAPQPAAPCLAPLGWRSPTVLVGEQIRPDLGYGIAEASLIDGSTTLQSRFSDAIGCEYIGQCDVWRIRLATNLLADTTMRDDLYADRGPMVASVHFGPIVLFLLGAGLVSWRVIHRRRRRRRQPFVRTNASVDAAVGPTPSGT